MVRGDGAILARSGQGKRPDGTPDPQKPRQSGLAPKMEQWMFLQFSLEKRPASSHLALLAVEVEMARCAASHCYGPLVALGLDGVEQWPWSGWAGAALRFIGLVFVADGAEEEHQALFSRPTSTDTVSNESKQNVVEIGPGFAAAAVRQEALLWSEQIICSIEF